MQKEIPKYLYKYREFNENTLTMIHRSEAFYADPMTFNDPLDTKPTIQIDADHDQHSLEEFFCKWLSGTPKDEEAEKEAKSKIFELKYSARNYKHRNHNSEAEYYIALLKNELKVLLYKEISELGVFSLSEKWDSPLMWSHYAKQHHGLCFEYDMTNHGYTIIQPVEYSGSRIIKISDLIDWKLKSSKPARQKILNASFFTKAPEWSYECEWRDINEGRGVTLSSKAKISSIYFGSRCNSAVIATVIMLYSALKNNSTKFYQISLSEDDFKLIPRAIDEKEIQRSAIQQSLYEQLSSLQDSTNDQTNI